MRTHTYEEPEHLIKLTNLYITHAHVWLKSHDASVSAENGEAEPMGENLLLGAGPM